MIKTFEQYNEIDPYGEEDWGDKTSIKELKDEFVNEFIFIGNAQEISTLIKKTTGELVGFRFWHDGDQYQVRVKDDINIITLLTGDAEPQEVNNFHDIHNYMEKIREI